MNHNTKLRAAVLTCGLLAAGSVHAASEQQSLEELRNTVVNLLQALVEQGVMTRDKAQSLVQAAQAKAEASVAEAAAKDEGAVRVTYVPEIVRQQIGQEVAKDIRPGVVADVLSRGRSEGWAIPGALPDWLSRVTLFGDVRMRLQSDNLDPTNARNFYLDFQRINELGGITRAGPQAFQNTTVDRMRARVRVRFGAEARLPSDIVAGLRLTTGALNDPGSPNQTLGNTAAKAIIGLDQAYVSWQPRTAGGFNWLALSGGRIPTPWFTPTELVYDRDLTFEGIAVTGRLGLGNGSRNQSHAYLTLAAMPIQDVELTSKDKVLYGAQLGGVLRFGDDGHLRLAAGYFDHRNVQGRRNTPDSVLFDYTAPQFVRKGNTMFDIRNDTDPTTNLFALASRFELATVSASLDFPIGAYTFTLNAEGVQNIGYDVAQIRSVTGATIEKRNKGYVGEVSVGSTDFAHRWAWRTLLGYRYVERDAVLDAWTDSVFRGGGTDTKGFYLNGELALAPRTVMRVRYLSTDAIDGAPFSSDQIQVDFQSSF